MLKLLGCQPIRQCVTRTLGMRRVFVSMYKPYLVKKMCIYYAAPAAKDMNQINIPGLLLVTTFFVSLFIIHTNMFYSLAEAWYLSLFLLIQTLFLTGTAPSSLFSPPPPHPSYTKPSPIPTAVTFTNQRKQHK